MNWQTTGSWVRQRRGLFTQGGDKDFRRRRGTSKGRAILRVESLEDRRVLTGTAAFPGNECAPDLNLAGVASQNAIVGTAFTLDLRNAGGTTTDLNVNGTATNNTIRFVLDADDSPSGATLTAAGVFTWTPTASQTGTHTITVIAIDTGTPPLGDAETFVIQVGSAAPVVDLNGSSTGTGASASFVEDGGSVLIVESDLTVTDSDSTTLASATVRISNLLNGAAESLSVTTTGTSITQAYDAATGTLTLTGNDSLSDYQTVLRTLRYNNTSQTPNTTARTIEVRVNDGGANSAAAISTVSVAAANDGPDIAAISDATGTIGQMFSLTVTATDPEGDEINFVLDRDDPNSTTPANATIERVNATSAIIRWTVDQAGSFTFKVLATDVGSPAGADVETFILTVEDVVPRVDLNGAASGTGFSATFTENGGAVAIVDPTATVVDTDSAQLQSATITLQNRPDGAAEALSITPVTGVTASYNVSTGVLTVSGAASVADYQTMLRSLMYNNTSEDPDSANRTVRVVVSDGTHDSVAVEATITVAPLADAPVLTLPVQFSDPNIPVIVTLGSPITFTASATDVDSAANELEFSLDLSASGIGGTDAQPTISMLGGNFSWTPDATGTFMIDVVVRDPGGLNDRQTFVVRVDPVARGLSVGLDGSQPEHDSAHVASTDFIWAALGEAEE